ncbi:MAG: FixH family protein [Alphaproteobacteria bacterium]|nr:FixH family protein [Alphaproteobacteria bacterium]
MNEATTVPRPFTGRHMLIIMVAFFGVVIAVNIGLAVIAHRSFTGLVVENSYTAGQTFDQDTSVAAANAAKDVHPGFAYANGKLDLKLHTAAGAAIAAGGLKLTLGHAVSATTDQVMNFTAVADGEFVADAKLTPGLWSGELTATLPDGSVWSRPIRFKVD